MAFGPRMLHLTWVVVALGVLWLAVLYLRGAVSLSVLYLAVLYLCVPAACYTSRGS